MRCRQFAVFHTALLLILLVASNPSSAFGFDDVVELARKRAASAYQPGEPIPDFMRNIDYARYQSIRFDSERSLWRSSNSHFQVQMLPAGSFYRRRVRLHVIDSSGVHAVPFEKTLFQIADVELEKEMPADLGFAGFHLTFPDIAASDTEPFLTFAAGSYFQAIGRHQRMGTFGRGIAIDTGLASGEEFPDFVEFWLERPAVNAHTMRLYGLLDGSSLSGAYEFIVTPGDATRIAVRARLFLRNQPQVVGVAPLTGMFLYGENTGKPAGQWRPRVHDANGLLLHDGASGEWLWRPLINPRYLLTSQLQVEKLRGFGLMQRNQRFEDFQDVDARYERHPSVWVTPKGDWGKGHVSLMLLPAPNDTNRNVVAFFEAAEKGTPDKPLAYDYEIQFGDLRIGKAPLARAVNTFVADANRVNSNNERGSYLVSINFAGEQMARLSKDTGVIGRVTALDGGRVLRQYVEYVPPLKGWRLSMVVKPGDGRPLALRAYLLRHIAERADKPAREQTLSETGSYELPIDNDILQVAP